MSRGPARPRGRGRHAWTLLAAALTLSLAACTSSVDDAGTRLTPSAVTTSPTVPGGGTASAALVDKARLDTCPGYSHKATPLPDGLPDLTLPCLGNGDPVRIVGLRGRPMVVNLWASWCTPCRDEIPLFVQLASASASNPADTNGPTTSGIPVASPYVIGIDVQDQPDKALSLLIDLGVHYSSLRDDTGQTKTALRYLGLPMTLFIDADGVVTYEQRGPIADTATMNSLVLAHLGLQMADS